MFRHIRFAVLTIFVGCLSFITSSASAETNEYTSYGSGQSEGYSLNSTGDLACGRAVRAANAGLRCPYGESLYWRERAASDDCVCTFEYDNNDYIIARCEAEATISCIAPDNF